MLLLGRVLSLLVHFVEVLGYLAVRFVLRLFIDRLGCTATHLRLICFVLFDEVTGWSGPILRATARLIILVQRRLALSLHDVATSVRKRSLRPGLVG